MPSDHAQRPDAGGPSGPVGPGAPDLTVPRAAAPATAGTYFLGRYRVVDEIGIGGMASVHLARMDGPGGFQKWVAIKRIHPHLIEDDSFIHMFLDEARIAARISHPNVATVFELGKHEDTYWIAMEYLHGEPLREVMRRTEELGTPMPPEIACRVIADAAEGLHAAHELLGKNGEKLNLIHRDVTPHNLFVTYEGNTKVVDFGIAKFSSRMSSTRAGTLKGKLAYMSPEQVQGETIDRRTDIFALGVVLWELTTGQRLFRMESDLDTLAKVQECNIPRPSTIVRGYPIDLEKIVMKALAKNRGERFKTAREFSRMLQSLLMKRGLFIASDEVAAYVQSIFKDRIERREAHLRWAGEVTQTINVDALSAAAPPSLPGPPAGQAAGADPSYRSDVQAAAPARQAPRPAAGVPAPAKGPASVPLVQAAPRAAPPLTKPPAPSAQPAPGPKQHPSASGPRVTAPSDDDDDAPTLHANAAAVLGAVASGREQSAAPAYAGGSDFGEDFEDVNDTIVSAPPTDEPRQPAAAPLPAAGRPAAGGRPSRLGEPPISSRAEPRTLPINTASPVSPSGPYAPDAFGARRPVSPANKPGFPPAPLQISDPSLPPTSAPPVGPAFGAPASVPEEGPLPAQGAELAPTIPPPQLRVAPTVPRMFVAPPGDRGTATVQAHRVRAPWWAVAILAGTAVFMLAGVILLAVTLLSSGKTSAPAPTAGQTAAPAATAAASPQPSSTPTSAAASGATATGPGVFGAARAAFEDAITVAPPSPPPPPAPARRGAPATDRSPDPSAGSPGPTDGAGTPGSGGSQAQEAPTPPAQQQPSPQQAAPAPAPPPPAPPSRRAASASESNPSGGSGFLTVVCLPGCDQVYDNGKALGPSPIFKRATSVGQHKIRLVSSNPSAQKTISTVVVADGVAMVRESMP